jgi:DNA repair protein RecN (Recombination protein N)
LHRARAGTIVLTSLHIKDIAIIDEMEIAFGPGLNVMTGETGAGKTIIANALTLVLGGRASVEAIRAGASRATITAVFELPEKCEALRTLLENAGLDADRELILHREVTRESRGRIVINGVPSSQTVLKAVASRLADISSQHEHQLLLEEAQHAPFLDRFGGHGAALEGYRAAHRRYASAAQELRELEAGERAAKERLDFLTFQLRELADADPKPHEDEAIEAERMRLRHACLLEEKTRGAIALVEGDEGVQAQIARALQLIAACAPYEPMASGWQASLARSQIEAAEAARELARYAESIGAEPDRLEALDERLHLLRSLARKHGGSIEACIARRAELAHEIEQVTSYDERFATQELSVAELAVARRTAAKALMAARRAAAEGMGKRVAAELADLGMQKTQFAVRSEELPEEAWDDAGPDRVAFLIAPNVGEPLLPLARIASGGELSRAMLALKGALGARDGFLATSVFDEVDSGIGGAVATVVGRKLRELARSRQIICITHLPQIAAFAQQHLRIEKRVAKGRTITSLEELNDAARAEEIARMLGEGRSATALAHAREMLLRATSG